MRLVILKVLERCADGFKQLLPISWRSNQDETVQNLVEKHKLLPHPEGGWYRRTFQSNDSVMVQGAALTRYKGEARLAGTSILYLLGKGDYSGWHSVQSDETWCFHLGGALLLRFFDSNSELNEVLLGGNTGALQFTMAAGTVFSAEPLGAFSLVGCVVTPGFDFKDFKLITQEEFAASFPKYPELSRLVRG